MNVKPRTNLVLDTAILGLFVVVLVSGLLLWVVYPSGGTRARGRHESRALAAEPKLEEVRRSFYDQVMSRWDAEAIQREVLASQRRRRLVGRNSSWRRWLH